jgi:hypothetical protein
MVTARVGFQFDTKTIDTSIDGVAIMPDEQQARNWLADASEDLAILR